jgi:hypothetical protein
MSTLLSPVIIGSLKFIKISYFYKHDAQTFNKNIGAITEVSPKPAILRLRHMHA